jgi:hypothetical protein
MEGCYLLLVPLNYSLWRSVHIVTSFSFVSNLMNIIIYLLSMGISVAFS